MIHFSRRTQHTSIGDLGGVPSSRLVTKIWESRANLAQSLEGCAPSWSLILGQSNLLNVPSLGVLNLGNDWHDLIIEPSCLLRSLCTLITLCGKSVLLLTTDIEVFAHILGCLAHGLHAVSGLLVLEDLGVEGLLETVAANGHHLCAHGNTDIDIARCNLIRNVLCSLQSGGAESIYGGGGGCIWEAGSKSCRADFICGFAIGDLEIVVSSCKASQIRKRTLPQQISSTS